MKRQLILASSFVLALAASAISFTGAADAAVFRHHGGGGHAMNHFRGNHFYGGHRYAYRRGYGRHWAGVGWRGGYYGGYYDYCGPVQLALGLCVPYRPYYYGPFGIL